MVRHADDHVHVVVCRVSDEGTVWHGRNDRRAAQSACTRLKLEHDLQTAPRRCVVVVGADADLVMEALRGLHVEIVRHAGWADGMGTSLAALRAHVHEDTTLRRSLILGCDQPALDTPHLRSLLEEADLSASGCATSGYAGVRGIPGWSRTRCGMKCRCWPTPACARCSPAWMRRRWVASPHRRSPWTWTPRPTCLLRKRVAGSMQIEPRVAVGVDR